MNLRSICGRDVNGIPSPKPGHDAQILAEPALRPARPSAVPTPESPRRAGTATPQTARTPAGA